MPLLDDARALLEIDRQRRDIAREHAAVLIEAEERANRLARLGDEERPKTLAFLNEAASLLPPAGPGAGTPGGPARPSPSLSSTGGRGAGGGQGGGGSRLIPGARTLTSQRGGIRQSEDFVREHCSLIPGGVEIPNPRNPFALVQNDMVKVPAWDCSVPLGVPDAVFLDPDAMQALLPARVSSRGAGGGAGGGSRASGGGSDTWLGSTPGGHSLQHTGGSSTVAPSPQSNAPTPDARLVQAELRAGFGMLAKELRAGGDLGLQIRRNGGL